MGELDPLRIISKCGSYHNFLIKYEKDYEGAYSNVQSGILEFVSTRFAAGMRVHELSLLKLLTGSSEFYGLWELQMEKIYGIKVGDSEIKSVRAVLTNEFFRGEKSYPDLIDRDADGFAPSAELLKAVSDESFMKDLNELLDFGIYRYKRDYQNNYQGTCFNLYKKYTYRDVCWLLNWKKEEVSLNIGGYKFDKYSNTYPVFINYEKAEDVGVTTRYEDRFNDPSNITAISKSRRSIDSDDVDTAIHSRERGVLMPLFVRKNKDDHTSKEFYFLGTMEYNGYSQEFIMPGTTDIHAVEIGYRLNTPVESNLYEYLTDKSL